MNSERNIKYDIFSSTEKHWDFSCLDKHAKHLVFFVLCEMNKTIYTMNIKVL